MQKINFALVAIILALFFLSSCGNALATTDDTQACNGESCNEEEVVESIPEFFMDEEPFEATFNNFAKYRAPSFNSSWGLKRSTYDKAVNYYQSSGMISNPRYMVVIDFSQHSSRKRMYLFDMSRGTVTRYLTSHGKGSDKDDDGFANQFSNANNSKMSSLGFYLTLGTYRGKHGTSLKIRGLNGTNSNAEKRGVVFHGAKYVRPGLRKLGRSWGCPAVENKTIIGLINKIRGGALVLIDD